MSACGTINMVTNAYGTVFEAIYQPSYRHHARRLPSGHVDLGHDWPDEVSAVVALEEQARRDGARIGIQAGKYPRGTRRCGDTIA